MCVNKIWNKRRANKNLKEKYIYASFLYYPRVREAVDKKESPLSNLPATEFDETGPAVRKRIVTSFKHALLKTPIDIANIPWCFAMLPHKKSRSDQAVPLLDVAVVNDVLTAMKHEYCDLEDLLSISNIRASFSAVNNTINFEQAITRYVGGFFTLFFWIGFLL